MTLLRRPFFPLLLGAYPSLFIFGRNRGQLDADELWLPLAVGVLVSALVWLIAHLLLRDAARSALAAALIVILGHTVGLIPPTWFQAVPRSWLPYLTHIVLSAWTLVVLLALGGLLYGTRGRRDLSSTLTPAANVAALVLVALALVGAIRAPTAVAPREAGSARPAGELPDIYYIVLDGYGGSHTLRETYGVDDTGFLDALRDRDFYVAPYSFANYLRTIHSLATALDMDYLEPPPGGAAGDSSDLMALVSTLHNNRAMRLLRAHGYEIYAFESGYGATNLRRAGRFLTGRLGLSEFQNTILNLTPIPALLSLSKGPDQYELHRRRIRYTLDELPRVAARPGPKFVFAHVMAPHPPFVFDRDGAPVPNHLPFTFHDGDHFLARRSKADYLEGYAEQVRFVQREVLRAIDGIRSATRDRTPTFVLQGDHGPGVGFAHEDLEKSDLAERAFILNAYGAPPASVRAALYPSVTPVNSFRLLLGRLLDEDLPLLPDRAFFGPESRPYDLVEITDRLEAEIEARAPRRQGP